MRRAACLICLVALSGCDIGRASKLEQEVARLTKEVENIQKELKRKDLDLQAKCSKDATALFREETRRVNSIVAPRYISHYNATLNKCFVKVEVMWAKGPAGNEFSKLTMHVKLTDVYENQSYGELFEHRAETGNKLVTCDVQGRPCKSAEDFATGIAPLLEK